MAYVSIWHLGKRDNLTTREGYEKNIQNAKYIYNILFIRLYLTSCPYHIVINKLLCASLIMNI